MAPVIKFPERLRNGLTVSLIVGGQNAAKVVNRGNVVIADQKQRMKLAKGLLFVTKHNIDTLRCFVYRIFGGKVQITPITADRIAAATENILLQASHIAVIEYTVAVKIYPHRRLILTGMTKICECP